MNKLINKVRVLVVVALAVSVGASKSLYSQNIVYKELFEKLPTLTPSQAYYQLFAFQKQDPTFASVYLQLGHMSEQNLNGLDLLREMDQANHWLNNAVLFYNLFQFYFKENDVRRNREFYENLVSSSTGKRISVEDVLAFQQERLNYSFNYKDTLTRVYNALRTSKGSYNSCIQIFNSINSKYQDLNEALLQTDDAFLHLIDSLKFQYECTIDTFKYFQELIEKFPIGSYKQQFTIKSIETYRLEGMTNSDFLADNFTVWNYGKWVSDYKEIYTKEILPLRAEIIKYHEQFLTNRKQLALVDTLPQDYKVTSYDDVFFFQLGKYESGSIIRNLFEHYDAYQNLLVLSKSDLNNPNDSTSLLMNRKLRYYYRLSQEHVKAKGFFDEFERRLTPERTINHRTFFNTYLGGDKGTLDFLQKEHELLTNLMKQNFARLDQYLENEHVQRTELGYTTGRQKIPLFANAFSESSVENEPILVFDVFNVNEQPVYLAGSIKKPSRQPIAFVAKAKEDHSLEWVREVGQQGMKEGDKVRFVHGFDEGVVAVATGLQGDEFQSTYLRLNENGGVVFRKDLAVKHEPCFLQFSELSQNALVGYGVASSIEGVFHEIILSQIDSLGNSMWNAIIPAKGNLVDVVRAGEKALAFINYVSTEGELEDLESSDELSFANTVAIINLKTGDLEQMVPLAADVSYAIDKVFSISSSQISLIGKRKGDNNDLVYIVVDDNGKGIYSSLSL